MIGLLDGLVSLVTGLDALPSIAAPWRYVFSSSYRQEVRDHWRHVSPSRAALEQICGVFLAVLSAAFVAFLVAVSVSLLR